MVQSNTTQSLSNPVPIPPKELSSIADARASFGYPMLLPTAIPEEYGLKTIRLYSITSPVIFEVLHVRYETSSGSYLMVKQGVPLPVGEAAIDKVAPEAERGTATVSGQPAPWARGTVATPGGGTSAQRVWQTGPLTLAWKTGQAKPPSKLYSGFSLQSDGLTLDQLIAIGNSVKPV